MNNSLFLSCVADPTRYTLLEHLARGDACVRDLVAATGHSQSNVSHHLQRLRECGFVTFDRDGKSNRYRLAHASVADFVAAVGKTTEALTPLCACEVCT